MSISVITIDFWNTLVDSSNGEGRNRRRGILEHPPAILPGVREALPALAEHYTLGIVSDTAVSSGSVLKEVLENAGLLQFFSHFSFSDETGVAKPHSKAYTTVLDATGTPARESLHIGDIERTDVAGARDLDMYAILFAGDHANSVVKSDVSSTRAHLVSHHWDEVVESIRTSHIWRS